MQPKFINYHIGSRNVGVGFRVFPAFARDIVNLLFDADADTVEHTRTAWKRASECETHVFPYCLADADGTATLRIAFDAYASSLLAFNDEFNDFYMYYEAGNFDQVVGEANHTMEQRSVQTHALDGLLRREEFNNLAPDFLSIDTQGAEGLILQGAARALRESVVGLLVEVEFAELYKGQALFADLQRAAEAAGFRLAALNQHGGCAPFRGPIGARADGFILSGDALFLRRLDTIESAASDIDGRYAMLQKLAFVSVMFEQLEYALMVLDAASKIKPSQRVLDALSERTYFVFLQEMIAAVAALPAARPPTTKEAMTFSEAQARFKVEA